jgi:hypothetical protein
VDPGCAGESEVTVAVSGGFGPSCIGKDKEAIRSSSLFYLSNGLNLSVQNAAILSRKISHRDHGETADSELGKIG